MEKDVIFQEESKILIIKRTRTVCWWSQPTFTTLSVLSLSLLSCPHLFPPLFFPLLFSSHTLSEYFASPSNCLNYHLYSENPQICISISDVFLKLQPLYWTICYKYLHLKKPHLKHLIFQIELISPSTTPLQSISWNGNGDRVSCNTEKGQILFEVGSLV